MFRFRIFAFLLKVVYHVYMLYINLYYNSKTLLLMSVKAVNISRCHMLSYKSIESVVMYKKVSIGFKFLHRFVLKAAVSIALCI